MFFLRSFLKTMLRLPYLKKNHFCRLLREAAKKLFFSGPCLWRAFHILQTDRQMDKVLIETSPPKKNIKGLSMEDWIFLLYFSSLSFYKYKTLSIWK